LASENRVTVWPPPEEHDYAGQVASIRESLGSREFARATIEGESMSIDDAIRLMRGQQV